MSEDIMLEFNERYASLNANAQGDQMTRYGPRSYFWHSRLEGSPELRKACKRLNDPELNRIIKDIERAVSG